MAEDNQNLETNADEHMYIRYYVVCLLDMLGQQSKLKQWARIPDNLQPTPEYKKALKQTIGSVLQFRQMFQEYFDEFALAVSPKTAIIAFEENRNLKCSNTFSKHTEDLLQRFSECRLGIQQFSDTFVFYAPLMNSAGDVSMNGMCRILVACCCAMVLSIAAGTPLRGAVCVGTGMELAKNNFYGPAMAEAHFLESKCAGYPRIVVSDGAKQFIQNDADFSKDMLIEQATRRGAALCRTLLHQDTDGKFVVDYLGETVRKFFPPEDYEFMKAVQQAYDFAASELIRFQTAGDKKLTRRYESLKLYMDSRMHNWIDSET